MPFANNRGNYNNNNNSNQNNNRNNNGWTSTRFIQLYNDQGPEPSTFEMGFWKNYVTFKFTPMLPENERKDNKIYDYDKSVTALMNYEVILTLNKGIKLLLKNDDMVNFSMDLTTNSGNFKLKVGKTAKEYEGYPGKYYISLYVIDKNGDKETVNGSIMYNFINRKGIENKLYVNWDENTGKAQNVKLFETQFNTFRNFLDYVERNLISGTSHHIITTIGSSLSNILNEIRGGNRDNKPNRFANNLNNVSRTRKSGFSLGEREKENETVDRDDFTSDIESEIMSGDDIDSIDDLD